MYVSIYVYKWRRCLCTEASKTRLFTRHKLTEPLRKKHLCHQPLLEPFRGLLPPPALSACINPNLRYRAGEPVKPCSRTTAAALCLLGGAAFFFLLFSFSLFFSARHPSNGITDAVQQLVKKKYISCRLPLLTVHYRRLPASHFFSPVKLSLYIELQSPNSSLKCRSGATATATRRYEQT